MSWSGFPLGVVRGGRHMTLTVTALCWSIQSSAFCWCLLSRHALATSPKTHMSWILLGKPIIILLSSSTLKMNCHPCICHVLALSQNIKYYILEGFETCWPLRGALGFKSKRCFVWGKQAWPHFCCVRTLWSLWVVKCCGASVVKAIRLEFG